MMGTVSSSALISPAYCPDGVPMVPGSRAHVAALVQCVPALDLGTVAVVVATTAERPIESYVA